MRHAEVSYVGERDPEVVRLTARGLEQAAAAQRALAEVAFDLVVTSSLPRTVETAAVVAPGREPAQWREFAEWRGGRLDDDPRRRSSSRLFVGSLHDPRRGGALPRRRVARRGARPRAARVRPLRRGRVGDGARGLPRRRQPDPALARARRRPRVLRQLRAGAGVHQRPRPRRRAAGSCAPSTTSRTTRSTPRARRRWSTSGRS